MRILASTLALATLVCVRSVSAAPATVPEPIGAPTPMPHPHRQVQEADASAVLPAPVVMYSTSWCTFCTRAKDWLTQRGVEFVERDIEEDPEAARELERKALAAGIRKGGVPMFDVDGELVRGFDVPKLEELLNRRVTPASVGGEESAGGE